MHVVFVEPAFPANQKEFVRGLAKAGVKVSAVGERPKDALGDDLRGWLLHYEQVPTVVDVDHLVRVVGWIGDRLHVDRLEATVEAHILPVAQAREKLGIPGTSVRTAFLCRDKPAMKEVLREGGVPCGPFNFPTEVFDDPQVVANEFVVEIDHQTVGPYRTFAPPIRMDRTPTRVQSPSPTLDAHTDEVLREIGFDEANVSAMRAAGIVGSAPLPEGT